MKRNCRGSGLPHWSAIPLMFLAGALLMGHSLIVDTLPVIAQTSCVTSPSGLVSWWPGDGNAKDIVSGNHGTLRGGAKFAPGMVGQGYSFDGDGDFVVVPDSANLNITGEVTVDVWAKRTVFGTGIAGSQGSMLAKGAAFVDTVDIPSAYLMFFGTTDQLIAGFERADGSDAFLIGPVVTDSNFHHYTYVRSDDIHKLFMNGVIVASGEFIGIPGDTSGIPLLIGALRGDLDPTGFRSQFGGIIDEVQIFNRALSSDEVKAIFDAGSAGKCKPAPIASPTPVHGFKLTISGTLVQQGQTLINVSNGAVTLSQAPGQNNQYAPGAVINLVANPTVAGANVTWGGVDSQASTSANILMQADRFVTVSILSSTPTLAPTPTHIPTPGPTATLIPTPLPDTECSPGEPCVYLYATQTRVPFVNPVLLNLSIVNSIAKPDMKAQLIMQVPSGWTLSGSGFNEACTGQCSAVYEVQPGGNRSIEITLQPNQAGDFDINARLDWFFGGDKTTIEGKNLSIPVSVEPLAAVTLTPTPTSVPPPIAAVQSAAAQENPGSGGCSIGLSKTRGAGLPDLALLFLPVLGLVTLKCIKRP